MTYSVCARLADQVEIVILPGAQRRSEDHVWLYDVVAETHSDLVLAAAKAQVYAQSNADWVSHLASRRGGRAY